MFDEKNKWKWKLGAWFFFVFFVQILMSSANSLEVDERSRWSVMSFMYRLNNKRPMTLPWGTPLVTAQYLESENLTLTCWMRLETNRIEGYHARTPYNSIVCWDVFGDRRNQKLVWRSDYVYATTDWKCIYRGSYQYLIPTRWWLFSGSWESRVGVWKLACDYSGTGGDRLQQLILWFLSKYTSQGHRSYIVSRVRRGALFENRCYNRVCIRQGYCAGLWNCQTWMI